MTISKFRYYLVKYARTNLAERTEAFLELKQILDENPNWFDQFPINPLQEAFYLCGKWEANAFICQRIKEDIYDLFMSYMSPSNQLSLLLQYSDVESNFIQEVLRSGERITQDYFFKLMSFYRKKLISDQEIRNILFNINVHGFSNLCVCIGNHNSAVLISYLSTVQSILQQGVISLDECFNYLVNFNRGPQFSPFYKIIQSGSRAYLETYIAFMKDLFDENSGYKNEFLNKFFVRSVSGLSIIQSALLVGNHLILKSLFLELRQIVKENPQYDLYLFNMIFDSTNLNFTLFHSAVSYEEPRNFLLVLKNVQELSHYPSFNRQKLKQILEMTTVSMQNNIFHTLAFRGKDLEGMKTLVSFLNNVFGTQIANGMIYKMLTQENSQHQVPCSERADINQYLSDLKKSCIPKVVKQAKKAQKLGKFQYKPVISNETPEALDTVSIKKTLHS